MFWLRNKKKYLSKRSIIRRPADIEINFVIAEYQERIPCDSTRQNQLYYSTAKEGHPIAKFLFGRCIQSFKHTFNSLHAG